MRQWWKTGLGVLLVGGICVLAWWTGTGPLSAKPAKGGKVHYIQLHNTTPSPAWSPNGRYLAYHSMLAATPSSRRRYRRRRYRRRRKRRSTPSRRYRSRRIRRATPSSPMSTSARSRLAVFDVKKMKVRRFRWKRRRSTASPAAYFHPQWSGNDLLLTSSGFSGDNLLLAFPKGAMRTIPRMGVSSFGPQGRMIVGRVHQTGVYVTTVDRPKVRYPLVDKRRRVRGKFPRFSPNGKLLAWLDATTSGAVAAPLKIYRVPFTADTLKEHLRVLARHPWKGKKKVRAIGLKALAHPRVLQVVEFVWAPDSRAIVLVRGRRYPGYGNYQYRSKGLFLLHLEKEGKKALRLIDRRGENPSVAPDGVVYYNRSGGGLWRWSPKSGRREHLLAHGFSPCLSPSGEHLAFLAWKKSRKGKRLYLGLLPLH